MRRHGAAVIVDRAGPKSTETDHLLTARVKILEAEHRRERVLGVGLRLRVFGRPKSAA